MSVSEFVSLSQCVCVPQDEIEDPVTEETA